MHLSTSLKLEKHVGSPTKASCRYALLIWDHLKANSYSINCLNICKYSLWFSVCNKYYYPFAIFFNEFCVQHIYLLI